MSSSDSSSQQQQQPQEQGIDIRRAMEILAARASEPHSHSENQRDAGGCDHAHGSKEVPEECRRMGQVIDIFEKVQVDNPDEEMVCDADAEDDVADSEAARAKKTLAEKKAALDAERSGRLEAIEIELRSMSVVELLDAVLEAQQQRVAAYRAYDR